TDDVTPGRAGIHEPRRDRPMTATAQRIYSLPPARESAPAPERTVYLIPSAALRESANVPAWPYQVELEKIVAVAVEAAGWRVRGAFAAAPGLGHGCIRSPRTGMEVLQEIPGEAPLIVAAANWQYSHHVL